MGWRRERHRPADPRPEPLEGWDLLLRRARRPFATGRPDAAWGERRLRAFETEREEQRLLALSLVEMLERDTLDGAPMTAPTWHIGWLMAERARRRPERAEADRAWGMTRPWEACVWDAAGALRSQGEIDARFLRLWRADWREEQGLPDGAAEAWPVAAEA